jgi:oligoribonuclease (3'-5' exoribonuclease)
VNWGAQVIITDGNLQPVDGGVQFVVRTEKTVLDKCVLQCMRFPHSVSDRPVWQHERVVRQDAR